MCCNWERREPTMSSVNSAASDVVISASIAFDYSSRLAVRSPITSFPTRPTLFRSASWSTRCVSNAAARAATWPTALPCSGSPRTLVGAVGSDFEPYREAFEALGIDLDPVIEVDDQLTASAFMMSDRKDNQIASFYPGPSDLAENLPVFELGRKAKYAIVGATGPKVMRKHVEELGAVRLQIDLRSRVPNHHPVAGGHHRGNRFCLGLDRQRLRIRDDRTQNRLDDRRDRGSTRPCHLHLRRKRIRTSDERQDRSCSGRAGDAWSADPTGAGDAYRSGLIKGLLLGLELDVVGRIASLAATYVVELIGTQEHHYTPEQFVNPVRYGISRFCQRDFSRAVRGVPSRARVLIPPAFRLAIAEVLLHDRRPHRNSISKTLLSPRPASAGSNGPLAKCRFCV